MKSWKNASATRAQCVEMICNICYELQEEFDDSIGPNYDSDITDAEVVDSTLVTENIKDDPEVKAAFRRLKKHVIKSVVNAFDYLDTEEGIVAVKQRQEGGKIGS